MADIPCIKKAAELMGESMSKEDVQKFFDNMVNRTKVKAAQEGIPIDEAARIVASEVAIEQGQSVLLKKRKELQNFVGKSKIRENVLSGKAVWGKNIQQYIQKVMDAGRYIGNVYTGRFFAGLNDGKVLDLWNSWKHKSNSRDIFLELEQLNYKHLGRDAQPGITGNVKAQKIAETYFGLRLELQALKNRWGANIDEAVGYVMLQTHNSYTLKKLGKIGGKENAGNSYKQWRSFIDTLDIDWDRTLAGEDHDAFLKAFHDAIYSGVHGNPIDQATKARKFKRPSSSLPDKISSQRVLWFKDGNSAFKYNEKFGIHNVQDAILSDLRNSGRNIAMLQFMGANPVDNVLHVRDDLMVQAKDMDNPQEQIKSLVDKSYVEGQLDLLTGKANYSVRPWLTHTVDFIKNWTLATKGGTISISSLTDNAFKQSLMVYHGLNRLEQFAGHAQLFGKKNPEFVAELGVFNQSWAGSMGHVWGEEIKPVLYSNMMAEWMMKGSGLNKMTYHNQSALGTVLAHRMGSDAKLPFDKLEPRRQAVLREAGIEPSHWNAFRHAVRESDGHAILFPSSAKELPDEVIDTIIKGPKTEASRNRARDILETEFDYYIQDAITEGIPTPGAREQAIRSLNGIQRGQWSREMSELFFIFKGFTLKATMDTSNRVKGLGGMSGAWHLTALVAQAGILGYISMMTKDALKGRTPKRLWDDDGLNGKVWFESIIRGGGMGIYGDFLNAAYDRRYNSVAQAAAGPAFGEIGKGLSFLRKASMGAAGVDDVENIGYDGWKLIQNQLPLINMFYLKPVWDNLIMWHVNEMLSPGVFQRQKQSIEDHNYQEVWIDPVTN